MNRDVQVIFIRLFSEQLLTAAAGLDLLLNTQ